MERAFARCVGCGRVYCTRYEEQPPSRENLECSCGRTRFEDVTLEQAARTTRFSASG